MKRDHDQPCANPQPPRGGFEKPIEPLELVIHPDAEGLERPRRGIDARVSADWDGLAHNRRQAAGRVDRCLAACGDEGARNATGETFLAVGVNRVGQLLLGAARDKARRRFSGAPIHAHVERLVALKAESAAGRLKLHRGHAEVRQRAVHELNAALIEHVLNRSIVGVHEIHSIDPL